jgi:hypothetical protein
MERVHYAERYRRRKRGSDLNVGYCLEINGTTNAPTARLRLDLGVP